MGSRSLVIASASLLLGLSACSKEPAAQYRLSAEQLSWQGYQAGQVLRFSRTQDSRVRTYRVAEVHDRLETQYTGINWTIFPSKEPPQYQHLSVLVQRTDSVFAPQQVLELELLYDPIGGSQPELRAQAEWESFHYARLPLNEVNQGAPIDTLQYPGTELLPRVTLGTATYAQVIHVTNRQQFALAPGQRRTSQLYYARGQGVVAFEEEGSGRWYRLP